MGLKSTLNAAVAKAFDTIGDEADDGLLKLVTYNAITIGAYDPVADDLTTSSVSYPINVVDTTQKTTEQDWTVVVRESRKLIIEAADLGFKPSTKDTITLDGEDWNIMKVNGVPGGSIHIVFIRHPDAGG